MGHLTSVKTIGAGVGLTLTYFLGGWDTMLQVLVGLMILDYITGMGASAVLGRWSSKTGFIGILKKAFILVIVAIGHGLDQILPMPEPWIRTALVLFYVVNECLSILENAAELKIPVPAWILKLLAATQEDTENAGNGRITGPGR